MTTDAVLLDANVLIAVHFEDHFHFAIADAWLKDRRFASTPSTQGSLLRYTLRIATRSGQPRCWTCCPVTTITSSGPTTPLTSQPCCSAYSATVNSQTRISPTPRSRA